MIAKKKKKKSIASLIAARLGSYVTEVKVE